MKRWNWKKCVATVIVFALLVGIIPPVSAADEPLAFVTPTSLPSCKIGEEYSYQLEATGGTPPYKFYVSPNTLPQGMSVSEDGLIQGTPSSSGYFSGITIRVTDDESVRITKTFKLRVTAIAVHFEVTGTEQMYDGQPHGVTVTPYINNKVAEDLKFSVMYGNSFSEPVDVGNYHISIYPEAGYSGDSLSEDTMYIRTNSNSSISLSGLETVYDGTPKAPEVHAIPEGLRYELTYVDANGQAVTSPTLPGTYMVYYRTLDINYTPQQGSAIFTIQKLPLSFTAEDGSAEFAEGEELTLPGEVTAQLPEGCALTMPAWHLEYDDLATTGERETLLAVVNAGHYGVYAVLDDPEDAALFDVPEEPIAEFTVKKLPVTFDVTESSKTHLESAQYATVTPVNVKKPEDVHFTVHYYMDGVEVPEPQNVGFYDIRVEVEDGNYCADNDGILEEQLVIVEAPKIPIDIDNWRYTYDGSPHRVTATVVASSGYTGGITVRYRDERYPESEPVSEVVNAGRYEIIVTMNDESYEPGELGHRFLVITPRSVTVSLKSKTSVFNGEEVTPEFNISQEVSPDQYSYVVLKDDALATLVDAGDYVVAVSFSDNYTVWGGDRLPYTITPQPVAFSLEDTSSEYNGETVTPVIVTDPELAPEKYTVEAQKNGTDAVIRNAGTYDVKITMLDGNYSVSGKGVTYEVTKKPLTFLVQDAETIMNDQPQEPKISVNPACLVGTDSVDMSDCTVTYYQEDGKLVNGLPKAAGTYTIHVKADNLENYEADRDLTQTFTIKPKTEILFTVEQPELVYTGEPQTVTITPPADYTGEYTVQILDPAGQPVDDVTEVGTYTITVTLAEPTQTPVLNSATVTVLPRTVSFALSSYEAPYTGQAITPQLTADPAWAMEYFTVTYRRGATPVAEIKQYGDYTVEITSNNPNYAVADGQSSLPFKVRTPTGETIYLEYGNTPFGLISRTVSDATTARQEAMERFQTDRLYNGMLYAGGAWTEGHDADLDAYAVVVTRLSDFVEPGFVAYNALGQPKAESAVSMSIEGSYICATSDTCKTLERVALDEGLRVLSQEDACLGVFTITYTSGTVNVATGRNIATRQLILIPKLGDANLDGSVNGADATYLLAQRSLDDAVPQAMKQLHEYRVCDAAHVGWDTADAWSQAGRAVLNRYVTPLVPFYQ